MSSGVVQTAFQQCLNPECRATFDVGQVLTACSRCSSLLDICYDWNRSILPRQLSDFQQRWSSRLNPLDYSGVWRFRELLRFAADEQLVTIGEGQTVLQQNDRLAAACGLQSVSYTHLTLPTKA